MYDMLSFTFEKRLRTSENDIKEFFCQDYKSLERKLGKKVALLLKVSEMIIMTSKCTLTWEEGQGTIWLSTLEIVLNCNKNDVSTNTTSSLQQKPVCAVA